MEGLVIVENRPRVKFKLPDLFSKNKEFKKLFDDLYKIVQQHINSLDAKYFQCCGNCKHFVMDYWKEKIDCPYNISIKEKNQPCRFWELDIEFDN